MASHSKSDVLATIAAEGIVPVFYDGDIGTVRSVASALVAGGLSTIEFTNRGASAVEVFAELIGWARDKLPSLIVGAGSVGEPATAAHLIDLGASFIFAPSLSAEVARVCHRRNIPYVPGCGTVTEIQSAYELGCDIVKLFPAGSLGGPAFLSAVRAPCPWVRAIPTGGVQPTIESVKAWFVAGAPAVGMGSKLLPKELIVAGDWAGIERLVADAVSVVAAARE